MVPSSSSLICFIIDQGAITISQIILSITSSLMSDPPTFTLVGDTSGGPPTTYTWTRNGQVITNNASYSISLQENLDNENVFRESLYRSRLTVTGRLPGVYQYSVTNRATSGMVTDQMTINFEGIYSAMPESLAGMLDIVMVYRTE